MWLGHEALEGKTILIGADEGFGDTIQFARYVPMLAARGARVVLVVQDPLHLLLSDLPGVSQCIPMTANTLPAFDMHCPTMSLPLAFGTRLDGIPAPTSCHLRPAESPRYPGKTGSATARQDCELGWSGRAIQGTETIITGRCR